MPRRSILPLAIARAMDGHNPQLDRLNGALIQLGQPLYGCVSPDGYACTESAWLSSSAVLERISIARRAIAGAYSHDDASERLSGAHRLVDLLGAIFPEQRLALVKEEPPARQALALLGSPEFMRC